MGKNNPEVVAQSASLPASSQRLQSQISRSLILLGLRQFVAYGSIFMGNIALSRHLSTEVYGLFAAALAFQQTLAVLSDVGLGAALVQRHETPSKEEIAGLFSVQLVIYAVITGIVFVFAQNIANAAGLSNGAWVVRAVALIFCITAFRSIPAILLERELRFDAIALAETVSTVTYQIVVVGLVYLDFGLVSIVWGLFARYITDFVLLYRAKPWRPHVATSFRSIQLIKGYLKYGLNMQGVRFFGYAKDSFPLLLLTSTLGATAAGQWGWALNYVGIPVYFNRLIDRVMFPAYARSQNAPGVLGELIESALWLNFAVGVPILVTLLLFANDLVPMIYGAAWIDTIPITMLLGLNMLGGFVTGSGLPVLYAIGKPDQALRLFVPWVLFTFLGIMVGLLFGSLRWIAAGYSISTLIFASLLIRRLRGVVKFDLQSSIFAPLLAAALAGLLSLSVFSLTQSLPVTLVVFTVVDLMMLVVTSRHRIAVLLSKKDFLSEGK
jgi:O-antigen/teichoic acid export membrane protein